MCRVQETLAKHSEVDASSENQSITPAVDAFKRNRLTFAWLDGEKQKVILSFICLIYSYLCVLSP